MTNALIKNRLASFKLGGIEWKKVDAAARGLSHAEITRACDDAAKEAVLSDTREISTASIRSVLLTRRAMKPRRERSKG